MHSPLMTALAQRLKVDSDLSDYEVLAVIRAAASDHVARVRELFFAALTPAPAREMHDTAEAPAHLTAREADEA